ncbi:MAG: PH domain-containing protein [Acidimicrobiia bacterium]|nr:PH domain-containing protein [Acidimicrobiia bacterium]
MGYPERLLSDDEVIVSEFRPHWLAIVKEALLLFGAAVVATLLAMAEVHVLVVLAVIVLASGLAARGLIRWLTTFHVITNERVIYRAGWIAKRGTEIPLENVNDVAFSQTILERMFRSGDLLIESAGTHGQSRYTDIPQPEEVQALIYAQREARKLALEGHGAPESIASQLMRLSRLHDEGKLTDDEYQTAKTKLIGGM